MSHFCPLNTSTVQTVIPPKPFPPGSPPVFSVPHFFPDRNLTVCSECFKIQKMKIELNPTRSISVRQPRNNRIPHIFLVDECLPRCFVNRELFRNFPCDVSMVFSGMQALEFLGLTGNGVRGPEVNMIITVYDMFGINGFQLLRIIKLSPINNVPVIITLPNDDHTLISTCLEGGALMCIIEPLRAAFVEELVRLANGGRG